MHYNILEMRIARILSTKIAEKLKTGKAIILLGPRQVGKTTLIKSLFKDVSNVLWFNGDELDIQSLFANISATRLKAIIGNNTTLIIDEAQRIKDIGLRLKLITDQIPEVQLIVTGSSALELANEVNEPLTGRKWEYRMYPVSFEEMVKHHGLLEEKRMLPHRLIYGYYPEVINQIGSEQELLNQLAESYLYKDVLLLDQVKRPDALIKLLQGLSFQVGAQVSYNELSQLCGIDAKTVEKYIILLEQSYVIFRLGSFSRNLRTELKKSRKIYFYDNGIRNALINNFSQIENRVDIGALWENFLVSERIKYISYHKHYSSNWYWRNVEQQEIDYIEEADGKLRAYEFKWNPKAKVKLPNTFKQAYPKANYDVIHPENFDLFLLSGM